MIALWSQIHTNTLCGQNVELLNVARNGTYSEGRRRVTQASVAQLLSTKCVVQSQLHVMAVFNLTKAIKCRNVSPCNHQIGGYRQPASQSPSPAVSRLAPSAWAEPQSNWIKSTAELIVSEHGDLRLAWPITLRTALFA